MGSTVYVVNKGAQDYSKATQYGDLVYITDGYIRYDNIRRLSHQINEALLNSKDTDFLVLSGNNLLCVIVCQIWMMLHKRINVLHWESREDKYSIVPITYEHQPIVI